MPHPATASGQPLPVFLKLDGKTVLVAGGGSVALRKVSALLRASADVTVVAPTLNAELARLAADGRIQHRKGRFHRDDLAGCALVFAATGDEQANRDIARAAVQQGMLVNVADRPALCSFIMPSIVDRAPVQIAISSGGASPVLARLLRARLETLIPAAYGRLAEAVADFRDRVKTRLPNFDQRRRFWEDVLQGPVAELFFSGREQEAVRSLERQLDDGAYHAAPRGEVYLVGGGPGNPDLLTFRALRLMQQTEVVLYDRLVAPGLVDLVRRDAERIFVGKQAGGHALTQEEINALLVRLAKAGRRVMRLKGGDPFIFGRGGEEIDTLAREGIPFQVVPGITAASGCACYAGIPLTHRDYAQSCIFVTAHQQEEKLDLPWPALVQPHTTIAVYMGVSAGAPLSAGLIDHGLAPDTPVAIVEAGTTPQQRVLITDLAGLPAALEKHAVKPPALFIIGAVVRLHDKLHWFHTAAQARDSDRSADP